MTWQQIYDPSDNKLLSTAISALPVLTLFFVLVGLKNACGFPRSAGF
jgi:hypothetical protein